MSFMNRYALHALLGLNLALALVLAFLWVGPGGKLRRTHWQPPAAQMTDYAAMLPDIPASVPMSTGDVMAMLERPLFTITRRPPPPPPPPKPTEAPAPDNLSTAKLTGVYMGQEAGGVILNIGGKDRRVRMREQVEGWTLSAIDQRSATFSNGDSQRVLPLLKGSLANFTGQVPAAPVPPPSVASPLAVPAPAENPATATSGAARSGRPQPVFGGSIR
ncbi:hypothetical protein [Acidovorax sp.]|uniref:hypothetical protein n=1 Tax=Acidovorax sp. TaxID=1872122 RepID=UPI002613C325|nr:hypothetical protein [Acidovorax sp.]